MLSVSHILVEELGPSHLYNSASVISDLWLVIYVKSPVSAFGLGTGLDFDCNNLLFFHVGFRQTGSRSNHLKQVILLWSFTSVMNLYLINLSWGINKTSLN